MITLTKRRRTGIASVGAAIGIATISLAQPTLAGVTYPTTQKHVLINGNEVTEPFGITAIDPNSHNLTTYMPIWYIMQCLKLFGITSSWNGKTWILNLQPYMTVNGDFSKVTAIPGYKQIYLNKTLIASTPSIAYTDPYSGGITTYMPIYYVMQILKSIGITPSWDGTNWSMKTSTLVTIDGPSVVTSTGGPINITWTGSGGDGNYMWYPPAQSIPPGLNYTNGELFGTPGVTGAYQLSLVLSDPKYVDNLTRVITVNIFGQYDITTLSVPAGRLNVPYPSFQLQANHPVTGIKWWVSSGALPPGLHLTTDGKLYGQPTKAGTYTFEVVATYPTANGYVNATRHFTIYVTY